jgi:hypothetical protein
MPRKSSKHTIGDTGRQVTLDAFLGCSSPSQPITTRRTSGLTQSSPSKPRRLKGAKRRKLYSSEEGESSSDVDAIRFEPQVLDLRSDSDSDTAENSSYRQAHSSPVKRHLKRPPTSDSDDDLNIIGSRTSDTKKQASIMGVNPSSSEMKPQLGKKLGSVFDSSEEEVNVPQKRKIVKGVRPPSPEDEDLMADLDQDSASDG